MTPKENPSPTSTNKAIYMSIADQNLLEQRRIIEDNIAHEKYQNELIASLKKEIRDLKKANRTLKNEHKLLSAEHKSLSSANTHLKKLLSDTSSKE
jgi:FtsZ-binding cell division protein ZapB